MNQPHLKFNMYGDNRGYEKEARPAFPILIQMAKVPETITYGKLAKRIGVSNPKNLRYPLGSITTILYELQEEW